MHSSLNITQQKFHVCRDNVFKLWDRESDSQCCKFFVRYEEALLQKHFKVPVVVVELASTAAAVVVVFVGVSENKC